MTTTPTEPKRRSMAAAILVLVAVAGGAAWLALGGGAKHVDDPAPPPSFVTMDRDGFRYEYHLVTGRETLFELHDGKPKFVNVIDEHKDVAASCRAELEKKLGQSLDSARGRYDETIRRLRALGYF
jgi:hypothetical protein